MGAKKTSGKRKSGGKKGKRPGQEQRTGTSFAGASFERSQLLGSGTQNTKINVQAYAAVPTALNSLPGLPQEFTGREDEITKILSILVPGTGSGAALGSVAGLPGVGKTTLAHAVGHAALDKGWFTGVQVVNLRGYDATPVPPEDALEALLRALGVAAEHIPPTLDEREGLYRSQLDAHAREGQRVLILADNASTSEQVRPLLPARHHAVLVTSRHALPGLGARQFNLHPLQPDASVDLLRQRLEVANPDDRRVENEPAAAEELAALCGYLPLALQIAAAILADDPDEPLSERVRMLTDAGTRLGGLDDGERNLRAVFDECLTRLSPQEADLYRLLGLHPGPDISTPAAAALTGQPAHKITPMLRQLVRARLLTQNSRARDRWSMHDLLRVHAQEQARIAMDRDRVPRRRYEQARTRLTDHYVRHAEAADTHLQPPYGAASALFAGRQQALAWFDAERENLLATIHTHARTQTALDLGFALGHYLPWRRRLQDHLTVRAHALEACQALGDTLNLAGALANFGSALRDLKRHTEALAAHQTALDLHLQTDDAHGQAVAWNGLGSALGALNRHTEALAAHQTALDLDLQTDDAHGQAVAWNGLGISLGALKRHTEALAAHQTALALNQQTDNTNGQAASWSNLGAALRDLKRHTEALAAHQTALDLRQQTDDAHGQAMAWNGLGSTLGALKRHTEALAAHQTALDLHQQTNDAHGQAVAWNGLGIALRDLKRHTEALAAHQTALDLHQQTNDAHGQAVAWNNIGAACRDLERYPEAIAAGERAVGMLAEEEDWALSGEAWAEFATSLNASGAETPRVREAWEQSATAYIRAGDDEAAATSRANAENPPPGT
ncbi:tetratricopeptide repeat protein [Streptomyces longhuiensis]|uniref:tetratricopeptide repeat protein n=1 Tax=Streptomyces longhuiensis TaxID=2880933 RepID=UPI001D09AD81|nr:tetratricopeptide repeat protein [Streptomyces longhuiensis]UDM01271.1 tetratricopeptide repeat protein [Streptomyces longhuiensis]